MTVLPKPDDRMPDGARRLARQAGLGAVLGAERLTGGGNNRVYRIETEQGPAVLKVYFRDGRDRLGAETAFTDLAWTNGVRSLPRPLAADRDLGLALFTLLPGRPPAPGEVDGRMMAEAAAFVRAVNRLRDRAAHLPAASEACFSLSDHLHTVQRRLERLGGVAADDPVGADAASFLRRAVFPAWERLAASVRGAMGRAGDGDGGGLAAADRIVSPSDFGFHNALIDDDGRICFLDFEYAGWDDPAKLIGDMFHQVRAPAPADLYPAFRDAVAGLTSRPDAAARRADLLRPVYGMKWIAILLNEFLPDADERRRFAGASDDPASRRHIQLAKARAAFDALHAFPDRG